MVFYSNEENAKAVFTANKIDNGIFVDKKNCCHITNALTFFGN